MWPEVERAETENRHELVLGGKEISKRLKDGLDPKIFKLSGLNFLDIHDTVLESIPDEISKLTQLQSLVLHSNKLQEFNTEITKLEKLKLLDLSRNHIKSIPEEINKLVNIVTLNFSHNAIEEFPKLEKTLKLSVLDLSNNKLKNFPETEALSNLGELKLRENQIEIIPATIKKLNLKVLELNNNQIKVIPRELAECTKLKTLELKNNPISDSRLQKLIDQCRTKQIVDYVKKHGHKSVIETTPEKKEEAKEEQSDDDAKHLITVRYAKENIKVIINESVKSVREHFIACLINNVSFTDETFKKFIQIQNKLHETVCSKRNNSTIATHDFNKLPPGDLEYSTLAPNELMIHPLNRTAPMSGAELFSRLQTEAHNLRKEKKRNTYSGIHKYLYLVEGHARFPCLLDSQGTVISFPPITNSEVTKIHVDTKIMLVEVTSSVSLHLCKVAMEDLLKELLVLLDKDLDLTQIKTTDAVGNLKNVYPSKTDLNLDDVKVVRV